MGHRNVPNYKEGAWWQNPGLVHNSTLFCRIFDTYELASGELGHERVCKKDYYIGRFAN